MINDRKGKEKGREETERCVEQERTCFYLLFISSWNKWLTRAGSLPAHQWQLPCQSWSGLQRCGLALILEKKICGQAFTSAGIYDVSRVGVCKVIYAMWSYAQMK